MKRTRFRTRPFSLILILFPGRAIATYKASNPFRVDVLATDPEGCLLASGGPFLLFAKHEVDFFGFDVLSNMPCGETVFVLFFSGECGR